MFSSVLFSVSLLSFSFFFFFFFNDTATTEIYTLSLHDALPIFLLLRHHQIHREDHRSRRVDRHRRRNAAEIDAVERSEEHTSELQSQSNLVCRLLLEKKKKKNKNKIIIKKETKLK